MAEIKEVFDDVSETVEKSFKKVSKSKTFWIIAGIVALVALIMFFNKSRKAKSSEQFTYAGGYTGYPITVGASEDTTGIGYDDLFDQQLFYENSIEEIESGYSVQVDDLTDTVTTLSNRVVTVEEQLETTQQAQARDKVLAQMQLNSHLYNAYSGAEYESYRADLHEENVQLGESLGLTYKNGVWYDGNIPAYTVDNTNNRPTDNTSGKTANSGTIQYDNNTDYSAKMVDAIMSGASGSTINSINDQRNAKIVGTGMTTQQANSGYDANVDYSAAIIKAKESGASQDVISVLEQKRQNKINDMYGGKDPASDAVKNKMK